MIRRISLWRAIVLLLTGGLGAALSMVAVAPALATMAPALARGGRGVFAAQLVMTVPSLAMLLTAPLVGWCAERLGYRVMLLCGILAFTITGLAALWIDAVWLLMLSRFFVGVASSAIVIACYALISYYFAGRQRNRMLGFMSGSVAAVGISGGFAAGFMVMHFGWHSVFALYAAGIPFLLLAFVVITDRNGTPSAIRPALSLKTEKAPLAELSRLLTVVLLMSVMSVSPTVQLPFLMNERGFHDPRLVSLIVMGTSLSLMAGGLLFDWLIATVGTRGVLALMLTMFGIGHLVIGAAGNFVPMFAGAAFIGFAVAFIKPVGANFIFAAVPDGMHGRAMGSLVSAVFLGAFLNPIVLSPVNSAVGMPSCFMILGVVSLVGALVATAAPLYGRIKGASNA